MDSSSVEEQCHWGMLWFETGTSTAARFSGYVYAAVTQHTHLPVCQHLYANIAHVCLLQNQLHFPPSNDLLAPPRGVHPM